MIVTSFVLRIIAKSATLIIYAITLAAAFGGYIDPRIWALPAILTLMLPYLAILTALLTLCWAISKAWITSALGAITIIVGYSAISAAVPLHFAQNAKPGEQTFKLITFNTHHTQDLTQPDAPNNRAIEWLIQQDADIVVMQELLTFSENEIPHFSEAMVDSIKRVYPYWASSHWTDKYVFSKYPVEVNLQYNKGSKTAIHYADFYDVYLPGHKIILVNCHLLGYALTYSEREVVKDMAHPQQTRRSINTLETTIRSKLGDAFRGRAESATDLRAILDTLPDPIIVCGDFNDVPASWTYRTIRADDFHDAFAERGFGPAPTFNDHLFYFRIDHILYRGDIKALSVKKGNINTSDHYPLVARFAFTSAK